MPSLSKELPELAMIADRVTKKLSGLVDKLKPKLSCGLLTSRTLQIVLHACGSKNKHNAKKCYSTQSPFAASQNSTENNFTVSVESLDDIIFIMQQAEGVATDDDALATPISKHLDRKNADAIFQHQLHSLKLHVAKLENDKNRLKRALLAVADNDVSSTYAFTSSSISPVALTEHESSVQAPSACLNSALMVESEIGQSIFMSPEGQTLAPIPVLKRESSIDPLLLRLSKRNDEFRQSRDNIMRLEEKSERQSDAFVQVC